MSPTNVIPLFSRLAKAFWRALPLLLVMVAEVAIPGAAAVACAVASRAVRSVVLMAALWPTAPAVPRALWPAARFCGGSDSIRDIDVMTAAAGSMC